MKNRGTVNNSRIAEKLKMAQETITNSIVTQSSESDNPILFVDGRLNRKSCRYIPKNLALMEGIAQEIKKYCRGLDLTVLNYLILRGIESIKKEDRFLSINYSDIETKYKL